MKSILPSLLCSLIAICCSTQLFAQQAGPISGTVTDATDNTPVPGCSVFINGSSRGTITDPKGAFSMGRLPPGNYDLVVSAIGYETYSLNFSGDHPPTDLKVKLKRRASELSAVTVEPYLADGWQRWGRFFINSFIGSGENAMQTRIRNTQALRFRYSTRRNQLTVTATDPLLIENKALGYLLRYQLESFTYNEYTHVLFYTGYPFFTEMTGGKHRQRVWRKARRMAYFGSMMQFMRDLYSASLASDGYALTQRIRLPNLEKERVRKEFDSARYRPETMQTDTLHYYLGVLHQDDFSLWDKAVTGDSLLNAPGGVSRSFFFGGQLLVGYMNAKEGVPHRQSVLWLTTPAPVKVWENGSYYPPQEIFSSGYWSASEKISNLLPLDYELPAP